MNAILNATVLPENGLHSFLCMLTYFLYALYFFCLRTVIVCVRVCVCVGGGGGVWLYKLITSEAIALQGVETWNGISSLFHSAPDGFNWSSFPFLHLWIRQVL